MFFIEGKIMSFNINDTNRAVLESISKYGLAPSSCSRGCASLLSSDSAASKNVSLNIFYPVNEGFTASPGWFDEGIHNLMFDPVNGLFSTVAERPFPISTDHRWVYFEQNTKNFIKRIENIYRNSIYLQIDTKLLPPATDTISGAIYSSFQGEVVERTFSEIDPKALKQGFVPHHLVNLFKETFPTLLCIPVEDTTQDMSLFIPDDVRSKCAIKQESISFTCRVPDYMSHVEKFVENRFCKNKTEALSFHVVRLASEEDVLFHPEAAAAAAE